MLSATRANNWRITVAGVTVRYRRRVTVFSRIETHTRAMGRDARFFYFQQSMYVRGEATSSAVFRLVFVDDNGMVPTDKVAEKLDTSDWNPPLPEWVKSWSASEAQRTWPPET